MATEVDLHVYRGETVTIESTLDPVEDITGWTVVFTLTDRIVSRSSQRWKKSVACVIANAEEGQFEIPLTPAHTNLQARRLYYDVWRTDVGSERCLAVGKFLINPVARVP